MSTHHVTFKTLYKQVAFLILIGYNIFSPQGCLLIAVSSVLVIWTSSLVGLNNILATFKAWKEMIGRMALFHCQKRKQWLAKLSKSELFFMFTILNLLCTVNYDANLHTGTIPHPPVGLKNIVHI